MRLVYEQPTLDTKFDMQDDYSFLRAGYLSKRIIVPV